MALETITMLVIFEVEDEIDASIPLLSESMIVELDDLVVTMLKLWMML
jgi:hypothetical protein